MYCKPDALHFWKNPFNNGWSMLLFPFFFFKCFFFFSCSSKVSILTFFLCFLFTHKFKSMTKWRFSSSYCPAGGDFWSLLNHLSSAEPGVQSGWNYTQYPWRNWFTSLSLLLLLAIRSCLNTLPQCKLITSQAWTNM